MNELCTRHVAIFLTYPELPWLCVLLNPQSKLLLKHHAQDTQMAPTTNIPLKMPSKFAT
jgi:hypothetical protein